MTGFTSEFGKYRSFNLLLLLIDHIKCQTLTSQDHQGIIHVSEKRFELPIGHELAYIDFAWQDGILSLFYIYVPVQYRGKGHSTRLIEYALAYATEKNAKVKVYCTFIARYIRLHPEHHHLLFDAS